MLLKVDKTANNNKMPMLLKLSKKPIVSNAIKTNKLIFIAIINPFFQQSGGV